MSPQGTLGPSNQMALVINEYILTQKSQVKLLAHAREFIFISKKGIWAYFRYAVNISSVKYLYQGFTH